jgi:hypothetical protein
VPPPFSPALSAGLFWLLFWTTWNSAKIAGVKRMNMNMRMAPFRVTYPGTWFGQPWDINKVSSDERREKVELAGQVSTFTGLVDGELVEASIALAAYADARAADRAKVDQIMRMVLPKIFARTYVLALKRAWGAIQQLKEIPSVSPQAKAALDQLKAAFPNLVSVRNTSAHIEERAAGKGKVGGPTQKFVPHAVNVPGIIAAPGMAIFLEILNGDDFASTGADGSYACVPVTTASFDQFVRIYQEFVDKLPWNGPPHTVPR